VPIDEFTDVSAPGPFTGRVGRAEVVARIRSHPLGDDVAEQRPRFERLIHGEHGRSDRPRAGSLEFDGSDRATIVYFHGGGYAFGSPGTHRRIAEGLAARTGVRVVLAHYPLAPEHRWPAQLDAVLGSADDLSGPIMLAGDSAGGHLALVTALALARTGRAPAGLILFSPNTDRSGLSATRERNDPIDPMVDDEGDRQLAHQCFGDMDPTDPQVSPVLDDLSLLPPLHVEVGADEVLLGDSLVLAERARAVGGSVRLHIERDGLHMGQLWSPWWQVANESLDRAAHFARLTLASAL